MEINTETNYKELIGLLLLSDVHLNDDAKKMIQIELEFAFRDGYAECLKDVREGLIK